jgi:hypothetical protein
MCVLLKIFFLVLLASPFCFAQDPMPVLSSSWQRTTQQAQNSVITGTGPARAITADDKYFQRKAREQRTDHPLDPNENSVDARSAAMEKAVQESRTPNPEDIRGYTYTAKVRNDSSKKVDVIFWEYRFVETARPTNVVRRQFLCAVNLKNGETKELSAFSLLGPQRL